VEENAEHLPTLFDLGPDPVPLSGSPTVSGT